jgi:hypothetical protein
LGIGANNGLVNITLAPFYDYILAIEPAKEMCHVLKRNVVNIPNIKIDMATGSDFKAKKLFNELLMYAVTVYLDEEELKKIILNLISCLKDQSFVLIGEVNDLVFREEYCNGLPKILRAKNFSSDRI